MKFRISRIPLIVTLLHTLAVVPFAIWIDYAMKAPFADGEIALLWLLWGVIDFPSGLLAIYLWSALSPTGDDSFAAAIIFGLIGGMHWYFLTLFLMWIRTGIRSRFRAWRGHCPYCNYNLRGSTGEQCTECGKWIPENVKIRPAVNEPGD